MLQDQDGKPKGGHFKRTALEDLGGDFTDEKHMREEIARALRAAAYYTWLLNRPSTTVKGLDELKVATKSLMEAMVAVFGSKANRHVLHQSLHIIKAIEDFGT